MSKNDNLLLGRVSGARGLCTSLASSHNHSSRVRRWARWAGWMLSKLDKQLRKDIANGL